MSASLGRVVPCTGCSKCARSVISEERTRPYMACTERGFEQVTEWDGCTLGEPGEPKPYIEAFANWLSRAAGA